MPTYTDEIYFSSVKYYVFKYKAPNYTDCKLGCIIVYVPLLCVYEYIYVCFCDVIMLYE